MALHPARGLALAIAAAETPSSFYSLQHIFVRRFALQADDVPLPVYAEHNWQQHSHTTARRAEVEVEMLFNADTAQRVLHDAALAGNAVILRISFPDGQQLTGSAGLQHYELVAEEGDALRSFFTLHSRGALTVSTS